MSFIQGADCVEGGFGQLDEFYDLGLRVLQLTHQEFIKLKSKFENDGLFKLWEM